MDEFKHFVPIPEKMQGVSWKITDLLYDVKPKDYMILYNLYHEANGQWHTGPSTVAVVIAFKNEEDAVKLRLQL